MPWQLWLMVLGLVVMLSGGVAGAVGRTGLGWLGLAGGFVVMLVGLAMLPNPPMDRASAARATIAAATQAVVVNELERAAATAAAAVNGGSE